MHSYRYTRSILSLLAITFAACGDPIDTGDDKSMTNAVECTISERAILTDTASRVVTSVRAEFKLRDATPVSVERAQFNGVDLAPKEGSRGRYYALESDLPYVARNGESRTHTFAVWGANGIPSLRDSIIVRPFPDLLSPGAGDTISRTSDLTIQWVRDTVVSERRVYDYAIQIGVYLSRLGDDYTINASIPDLGLFVIPAHILASADPGPLRIVISRRSGSWSYTTDNRAKSYSTSVSAELDVVVP